MSFLFVSADSKHREKIEEFLKSFPQDEVDFISGDDDGALDFNNEETFSIKKYTEEQRKVTRMFDDDMFDDEDEEEYDIELDLLDDDGNIIDYTVTFDYLDEDEYYDYNLYKEDFKIVRIFFDNGEVVEKEFMSQRYFDVLMSNQGFFYEDAIIISEIKVDKIFELVDTAIKDGVFEFLFDRVEKDFDIDEDFQNLPLN